jgi:hypothetical protein
VDIGPAAKSVTIKKGKKQIDVTALTNADDAWIMGRGNASGTIVCYYVTDNAGVTALINGEAAGTAVALDIGPASTLHYQFSAMISNVTFDNDGSDALILSFDYVATGAVTKATS